MKVSTTRSPTAEVPKRSKASEAAKKKTYRQRTMQEVKKSMHYVENKYDDESPENEDPAHKSLDLAVDSARTAGDYVDERISAYSSKLKSQAEKHEPKPSEKLTDSSVAAKARNKEFQKKKIKNDYAKAARDAQNGAKSAGKSAGKAGKKTAEKAESTVSTAMEKIGEFVAEHPMGCLIGALVAIVLLVIICAINSAGMIAGGMGGGSMTGTYTAEDSEIYAAEAAYSSKESSLQNTINNIEYSYPGYDEYNYSCDNINHNAWELISFLTVKHQDFTASGVSVTLDSLFDSQYDLDIQRVVETRYREEERTGWYAVPVYDEEEEFLYYEYFEYTYTVQVPYSYYILNVSLDNAGLGNVISNAGMNADDTEIYNYLLQTKGGKEYLF